MIRPLSRHRLRPLPPTPWWSIPASLILAVAFIALILLCGWTGIISLLLTLGLMLLGTLICGDLRPSIHLNRIAATRPHDSICAFARAFDCRTLDTAVIRAVYQELQSHLAPAFPIRPADDLTADLQIDPEDLEHMVETIAYRTRRTLPGNKKNPVLLPINTVSDLIHFFNAQPIAPGN